MYVKGCHLYDRVSPQSVIRSIYLYSTFMCTNVYHLIMASYTNPPRLEIIQIYKQNSGYFVATIRLFALGL